MSTSLRVCTTLDIPVATAWAAISRIETHVEWMADAESIVFRSPIHSGVGTEFDCVTKVGLIRLTDRMTITTWQPENVMGVDHRGVIKGVGRFHLTDLKGEQTSFCWEEHLTFPWWLGGRIGEWLARPTLARLWRGNLARLKQIAQAGSS